MLRSTRDNSINLLPDLGDLETLLESRQKFLTLVTVSIDKKFNDYTNFKEAHKYFMEQASQGIDSDFLEFIRSASTKSLINAKNALELRIACVKKLIEYSNPFKKLYKELSILNLSSNFPDQDILEKIADIMRDNKITYDDCIKCVRDISNELSKHNGEIKWNFSNSKDAKKYCIDEIVIENLSSKKIQFEQFQLKTIFDKINEQKQNLIENVSPNQTKKNEPNKKITFFEFMKSKNGSFINKAVNTSIEKKSEPVSQKHSSNKQTHFAHQNKTQPFQQDTNKENDKGNNNISLQDWRYNSYS